MTGKGKSAKPKGKPAKPKGKPKESDIDKSMRNVLAYSPDLVKKYGVDRIRRAMQQNNLRVRGHASGDATKKMNAQTKQDLAKLTSALREGAGA